MKGRTMKRHFTEAFKSIQRNGWMTVAAISAVTVTLLLVGGFLAILFNVNKLASDIENDVSVRVYIDLAADEEQATLLGEQLAEISDVDEVEFRSKDAELSQVVGSYGDDFNLFEGDDNPLYDVYVLNTTSPEFTSKVAEEAEQLDYVANVNYGGAKADKLFETMDTLRNVGSIIVISLLLMAVFLISNTIRITILSRGTEIEIMKLVGATNWFIRWPFLIEGALIGIVGALIPAAILSFVYVNGFNIIMTYLGGTYFALLPINPFLFQLIALMIGMGFLIGSIGSILSIRKFLDV